MMLYERDRNGARNMVWTVQLVLRMPTSVASLSKNVQTISIFICGMCNADCNGALNRAKHKRQ